MHACRHAYIHIIRLGPIYNYTYTHVHTYMDLHICIRTYVRTSVKYIHMHAYILYVLLLVLLFGMASQPSLLLSAPLFFLFPFLRHSRRKSYIFPGAEMHCLVYAQRGAI